MKSILAILWFGTFFCSNAQNKITFSYDSLTGNQVVRSLCLNCQTGKPAKKIEAITDEDLLKFSAEDVISYYPNPVKEELYLKWELTNENFLTSIQIIGISGQVLKTYQTSKSTNYQNVPFQSYPDGIYIVSLAYKNGEQKTIKIIKK
ncbi:T9SS type A sorting domain-containing protein [Flavobacterium pectinovorum]|uniref:T9SS type A sorting domain-containing protein n=1 Tax=Flavobacterium pectinovorum TaxID=29533 RepID=UPI001FAD4942|nr:T9SS type A sorting domain-containing protein [Flavobacterium pectinovorum]MCI9843342.1 T9SS type A sorting domain-containing protein [Flavobacterium pectinovorum]